MPRNRAKTPEFWDTVITHVTAKVEPVIGRTDTIREPVIIYLRDLEAVARRECSSRDALQVIGSGRRLLGDTTDIGPDRRSLTRR
ncbi:hypothetical protein ASG60_13075 [Methylobacterium sp. Leaf469]|jgi:hypothetical protein|nr:hypothetical protein ASF22_09130 [Methylobacterium sp. Leaf87]KQP19044.1 hypothetical protein ASF25_11685 [Methylobacterium sp. Leaf100]KQT87415.1 hypothetical protein ASG60_13075 [Methylobacterium sp. Leaf469]